MSRPPLSHPASAMGTGTLSQGLKRPGSEAGHLRPSSAGVKNGWSYTSTPLYVFMVWFLVKHRDIFTFYLHKVHLKKGNTEMFVIAAYLEHV